MDLVIFDCDGVLVDSEILAVEVDAELFADAGLHLDPPEIARRYCGLSLASMCASIEQEFGLRLPEDFEERSLAAVRERFERDLQAIPGIDAALRELDAPRCVASSSDLARIEHSLELTGLRAHFGPHLFSAQLVERGKPAPDLFLLAARRMGASPARCVVVEDSPYGVEAARAAGMRALGFAGGRHCGEDHGERLLAAGADSVFADMAALAELLAAPQTHATDPSPGSTDPSPGSTDPSPGSTDPSPG